VDHELIQTALRVLKGVGANQSPTPADIAILRERMADFDSSIPNDELACQVIQTELARRGKHKALRATA
jgi:hypothetical protein